MFQRHLATFVLGAALLLYASPAGADPLDGKGDVTGVGTGFEGTPPPGFGSWEEVLAVQERLDTVADSVAAWDDAAAEAGLGGVIVSAETRELTVYWKGGAFPSPVTALLQPLAAEGLAVTSLPSAYSQRELRTAAGTLASSFPTGEQPAGITAIGPMPDGSGLEVAVPGTRDEALAMPAIRDAAVHVEITTGQGAVPLTGRGNDTPPYYGGARYFNSRGGSCTLGFAVRTELALNMMVTAGHCVNPGEKLTTHAGAQLGKVADRCTFGWMPNGCGDSALIDAPSAGRLYWGAWDGQLGGTSGATSKPVYGRSNNHVGDIICNNGGHTGTWCGFSGKPMRIKGIGQIVYIADYGEVWDEVKVTYAPGFAAGQGDSGGPIVTSASDGVGLRVRGTFSSAVTGSYIPCKGDQNPLRKCWNGFWFYDAKAITARYGPVVTSS